MTPTRTGAVVLAVTLSACSADIVQGYGGAGGRPELPAPPNLEQYSDCPALLLVPGGDAWVGFFKVNENYEVERLTCDDPDWGGLMATKRLNVSSFYLDEDAVTNGCYAHCVSERACPEPPTLEKGSAWDAAAVSNFPVVATLASGEAYCRWRGGRLPSAAELARASHGASPNVTTDEAFARMIACWEQDDPQTPECRYMFNRAYVEANPAPIRDDPLDVGPYGHWDLFGSRSEITQTAAPRVQDAAYCALPDGASDPRTFDDGDESRLAFNPARSLRNAVPETFIGDLINSALQQGRGTKPATVGARCAYDPEQP